MALIGTLGTGVSALKSFERGLEVIGNNIANVNTTGYKSTDAKYADSFSNILQSSSPSQSGSNVDGTQIGTGVLMSGTTSNFNQGSISSTGKTSDLAISGSGFFRVKDPTSSAQYATRAGDFRIDDKGYLVTQQGLRVQGLSNGAIAYNATVVSGALVFTPTITAPSTVGDVQKAVGLSVGSGITDSTSGAFTAAQINAAAPTLQSLSIDKAGNVVAFMSNGDSFNRGQVLLQNFRDPNALTKEGNNLFSGFNSAGPVNGNTPTPANNPPRSNSLGSIQSAALGLSTVDLTQEVS